MLQPTRGFHSTSSLSHGRGCARISALIQCLLLVGIALAPATAVEVTVRGPLTTVVPGWTPAAGSALRARITVPSGAPSDLGFGVYSEDRHGRWYQRVLPGQLTPGVHVVTVPMLASTAFAPSGHGGDWNALTAARGQRGGLFLWTTQTSDAAISVTWENESEQPIPAARKVALRDFTSDGSTAHTGERYEVRFRPDPFPFDPYAADEFHASVLITAPDGSVIRRAAFYRQPMQRSDRGDREILRPDGEAHFAIRWRPQQAGTHRLAIEWDGAHGSGRCEIPAVTVSGEAWDDYVRVDANDPRFFSAGGKFIWPQGPNLRSVWDLRGEERLGSTLTPDRGSFAYDAYLARAAAGGANACEIWLSAWNLALEWNARWDGFYGLESYNEGNAWRLDHILDQCEALGIRVNLVVNNHGQGSDRTDREWDTSPWNRDNGGPLTNPSELFVSATARAGQERLRQYLCARYADSPAILGWKLWSEMNLTAGGREELRIWHEQAAASFAELDHYGHPVTTHWSGDYRTVDTALAALPGIGYVCIDAYHAPRSERGTALADLLAQGVNNPFRGLGRLHKPVVVTEFGGNWSAAPEEQIKAEHRSGGWLALMSGYAASPMLWWFEWIDQGDRWGVYRPVAAFLVGEDLRGTVARHLVLETSGKDKLWSACWSRPGRRLGYLMDDDWGASGKVGRIWSKVTIQQGEAVPPGPISLEWWDADRGIVLERLDWEHPGGALVITTPSFQHHLAYKMWRRDDRGAADPVPMGDGQAP